MSRIARIGLIGTGWWATTAHIPALISNPYAELVAISDARSNVLSQAAKRYSISNTYTNYRDMIDQEHLDGVVVAVWHSAHYEVAHTCLGKRLHVMLEKPMVLTAKHARSLVESSNKYDRELIIGYPWLFTTHAKRAQDVVNSGELGQIRYINCVFASTCIQFYRGEDSTYKKTFNYPVIGPGDVYSDPERSGGGQGHLQVTHSAGLMHFISGLKPVSVMALMNNLDVNVDVVDAMVVRMDNGALATVGSTGNLRPEDPDTLTIQMYCENGSIDLNFTAGSGTIHHSNGSEESLPTPQEDSDIYPVHATSGNLVDVISNNAPNGSPGSIGIHTVEMLDAAYRSASTGGSAVNVDTLY